MKHISRLASLTLLAPSLWCQTPAGMSQESKLEALLAQLSGSQFNPGILFQIEAQPPDPRTIPALEAAFDKRQAKQEKQWTALTLLRLGDKDNRYFDYLAGFVKQAVEDRAPQVLKYDSGGKEIKGQLSAEIQNWCALNHQDPKHMAALQLNEYPMDVMTLAMADDRRALDLFLQGLDSPYPLVVGYATEGLGRLGASSAIRLISQACERLPLDARAAVAMQLPWFTGNSAADQLLQRLVPDPARRDHFRAGVQSLRSIELQRTLAREGQQRAK